jgi:[ribosomal protein S18]-alanine N-acetyltransferase
MTPQALAALHRLCFTTPRPWTAVEFSEFLASPSVFLIERPKGVALGRIAGPEVELLTLAVHPEARRQGIAIALLMEFEGVARTKGAEQAFLEVSEQNRAAIALYHRQGYKDAGYRKNYYVSPKGPKSSALVMHRDLTTA